ncbi:hypothetical protein [Methanolobus halotolerans]|uniref:Uncharacterized protein n=1 Tax=Methanolobus halotolerans TaxID=2052935 RepID=A0A4E0PWX8_9EURY|nr:hypothetical protein [Methanolobus halotolerans]TGC09098.1 hypothetical protein CUN85_06910 [Methanolobus halotolerans]
MRITDCFLTMNCHIKEYTHIVLADVVVTPEGTMQEPVPTDYMLPDGTEQPFIHIIFEDTEIQGLDVPG